MIDKIVKLIKEAYCFADKFRYSIVVVFVLLICIFNSDFISLHAFQIGEKVHAVLKASPIFWSCCLYFFIFLAVFHLCVRFFLNKRIWTPLQLLSLSCLILGYVFYRVEYNDRFTASIWLFKYADSIVFLPFLLFRYYEKKQPEKQSKKQPNDKSQSYLSTDKHNIFSNTDLLKRKPLAKVISSQIRNSISKESYAYGIVGKWGQGKSQFMGFIREDLKKDENILLIQFNPWFNQQAENIIEDFFNLLKNKLSLHNSSIGKKIDKYLFSLIDHRNEWYWSLVKWYNRYMQGNKVSQDLYLEIDRLLKDEIKKKIVVIIDDLDRLTKAEIFEVLRLVRNTGSFYNTFYVVAYDRDYICNSLNEFSITNSTQYLNKIFQQEVLLPKVSTKDISSALKEYIDNEISEYSDDFQPELFFSNGLHFHQDIEQNLLEDLRDVLRLGSALKVVTNLIPREHLFADLLKVEMLKLKFPHIFSLILTRESGFLQEGLSGFIRIGVYELVKDEKEKNKSYFGVYLRKHMSELSINEVQCNQIISLIEDLFHSRSNNAEERGAKALSIRYISNFDKYYNYLLKDNDISEKKLIEIITNCDQGTFREYTEECVTKKNLNLLFERYDQLTEVVKTVDQAKFYLHSYVELLRDLNDPGEFQFRGFHSIIIRAKKEPDLKKVFNITDEVKKILVTDAKSPFHHEIMILNSIYLTNGGNSNYLFTNDEIKQWQLGHFKNFIENHIPEFVKYDMFFIYHRLDLHALKEANEIIINHLNTKENYLDHFLVQITDLSQPDPFTSSKPKQPYKAKFKVSNVIEKIFSEPEKFEKFLQEHTNKKLCAEYLDFFKKWKPNWKSGFDKYLEYDFSELKIEEKIKLVNP